MMEASGSLAAQLSSVYMGKQAHAYGRFGIKRYGLAVTQRIDIGGLSLKTTRCQFAGVLQHLCTSVLYQLMNHWNYNIMKPGSIDLYPNPAVAERVTAYASTHSTALPQHIVGYHAWVKENHPRAAYMISNFQGQCLVFLARAIGAQRVLEIGVYVGYSALVWAHAVGKDGSVTGLESSAEYAAMARDAFEKNGVGNVNVIQGDALDTLSRLKPKEPYDIIFIDAQKSGYPRYLANILAESQPGRTRLLRPGGLIVADNVLRRGLVADECADNPWATADKSSGRVKSEYEGDRDLEFLRQFNEAVVGSGRLEAFLMPLFDGVGMARLLD